MKVPARYFFKHILLEALAFVMAFSVGCHKNKYENTVDWDHSGGNAGQTKYSALSEINTSNVKNLKVAWTYRSGNMEGNVQCNPLIVKGIMYATTPAQVLLAVDATNGKEVWRFNPERTGEKFGGLNRGVACWRDGESGSILYTVANYLYRVDMETGQPVQEFGDSGRVNLNEGLVRSADKMGITSPGGPNIYKNYVIIGALSWSAPSNVSAFDIKTGKRAWVFNCIPQPGEYGYDTWGSKTFWKDGAGVNTWGGIAVDDSSGMVYFATGQPKDEFYRSNNKGEELYGNCIVALNANTGKRVWHYQAIHNDLWDLDLPCAPVLVNLTDNGKPVKGVMQLTKTGNILLFDRLTGKMLSKTVEVPVPASKLPGEYAYPTQPKVIWPEPFSRQVLTEKDLTNRTPEAHAYAEKVFSGSDVGWFVPPSLKGILFFGIHGGSEWGGGAYDEGSNTLFINANELAWQIKMKDINQRPEGQAKSSSALTPGNAVFLKMGCPGCHGANREGQGSIPNLTQLDKKYGPPDVEEIIHNGRNAMPSFPQIQEKDMANLINFLLNKKNVSSEVIAGNKPEYRSLGYNKFLDKDGYPATAPPWGTLNAVDLTTGKIKWKVPLGEYEVLKKQHIPITGTENFGGCIVTKGGLVFIGATRDEKIRAFDKETGKVLWEAKLPYGGYSSPSTYAVNGKQYIVIAATGGGKLGGKTGDAYVAFALP